MKFDRRYATIFLIMVTEVLGFSLILPFLPFYVEELGATPLTYGLILASFSLLQFISAPIMGRLSDHYGRRPMLIFSQMSTCLSFIILAFADNIWLVFLSRIVDGMLGSNFTIAQAYISDISSKKDRSKAFGVGGIAFGAGFLIGPAIGGTLAGISHSIPSFLAAGASFMTILMTMFLLPETVKKKKNISFRIREAFHFRDYKKYFSMPKISGRLWQYFSFALTHTMYVTSFAFFVERVLNFNSSNVGFLLTYVGFVSIIFRGTLLSRLIDRFGEKKLRYAGVILILLAMLNMIFLRQWWLFLVTMTLFSVGAGMAMPLLAGSVSRAVSPKEQGAIMGLVGSMMSISQIIGPLIGNALIHYFFPGSLGIAAAVTISVAFMLMLREDSKKNAKKMIA